MEAGVRCHVVQGLLCFVTGDWMRTARQWPRSALWRPRGREGEVEGGVEWQPMHEGAGSGRRVHEEPGGQPEQGKETLQVDTELDRDSPPLPR